MSDQVSRCPVCDWPMAATRKDGCVPGDCAYRPQDVAEQHRLAKRRRKLAAGVNPHTITHIAGVRLDVCGRVVQRCSLCGAKLCDSLNTAAPLNPDGSAPEFPTFPVGRLVQVETGNPTRHSVLPDTDKLPDDSCLEFA